MVGEANKQIRVLNSGNNSNNMGCGRHEDHHFDCRLRLLLPWFGGLRRPSAPRGQIRAEWPCTDPGAPPLHSSCYLQQQLAQRRVKSTLAPDACFSAPPTHVGVVLYSRWASTRPRAVGSAPFTLSFPILRDVSIPGSSG